MLVFRKAERRKARLRLAIAGPAGSGKTYSALLIAFGLGGRVAMIDTERGSGELYADLGDYDVLQLAPPFAPEAYIEAIRAAEAAGYGVIIIDSLSHAWAGEGGLLELHDRLAAQGGNSWAAWRQITPRHNALVEAMLQSPAHIIATMRTKTAYAQVNQNGRAAVKKLGLEPVQRDGMEYEFTVFLELSADHVALATKDRTRLFDGQAFRPGVETGRKLAAWLEQGAPEAAGPAAAETPAQQAQGAGEAAPGPGRAAAPEPPGTGLAAPGAGQPNWRAFWRQANTLGYTPEEVHRLAGRDSLKGLSQAELNALLLAMKQHRKVQAGQA